jgi:hypothetical protein
VKKYPRIYKDLVTTEQAIDLIPSVSNKMSAIKWLKRNEITSYRIDSRTMLWSKEEILNKLRQ